MRLDDSIMNEEETASAKPIHQFTEPSSKATEGILGCTFQKCDISQDCLAALLTKFDVDSPQQQQPLAVDAPARIVDLEPVLYGIKMKNDAFFPAKIYVRDCMKTIFGYFRADLSSENSNRVLLGSPGVGKSVLFFIAALAKSWNGDKPVVYIRKTDEEKFASIFVMVRVSKDLRVFSCRKINKLSVTLKDMRIKVYPLFGVGDDSDCVFFLDGPRHNDETDIKAYYQYFCTSGGHPLPKNAAKFFLHLWILDGWSKVEAIAALLLLGKTEIEAKDAYFVCGGCMRDMLEYANGDNNDRMIIKNTLTNLVSRTQQNQVELIITSHARNKDDDSGNPDRIRTMFNGESEIPHLSSSPIQIVDSEIVLRCLRGRLNLDSYHRAFMFGGEIQSGTVVGVYFEEMLHQWFTESPPSGVKGVCRPEKGKTGAAGVGELVKKGLYWIPSIPNFPNIDAAVIIKDVLYVFQYTKRGDHEFNQESFWINFVSVVRSKVEFERVHVYVVVTGGVTNKLEVVFEKDWITGGTTRATATKQKISCTSSTVTINTLTPATVRAAAADAWNCKLSDVEVLQNSR